MEPEKIFPDEYVPNAEGVPYHKQWVKQNPGEAQKWNEYRDAAKAHVKDAPAPAKPSMGTKYGKALVAAGDLHVSVTDIGSEYDGGPESPPPSPPSGTLLFHADMETTNILTQYDSMAAPSVNTGQVAPVTAENGVTPRRGSKMLRMEVRAGETAPWGSTLQAALVQKQPGSLSNIGLGYDNFQGISFYVYPGLQVLNPNMHCVFLEWHGTAQMLQAPFHFGINALNGQWYCDLHRVSAYSPIFVDSMGAHQTGVWMNVVSGIRWRSDSTGFYKLWLKQAGTGAMTDADLKVNRLNIPTWNTTGAAIYPTVCLYRNNFNSLGRVYFDSHRIGDTLEIVDPENYV
jgi:hypothetical protein